MPSCFSTDSRGSNALKNASVVRIPQFMQDSSLCTSE
uniref:Uncharacterized protein n=1 Tax=Anguilla anguilla TaxID=7936 RepID=A0A0E9VWR8_ANGAN